jgi:tetratricopeptide (TPR) repeat protein
MEIIKLQTNSRDRYQEVDLLNKEAKSSRKSNGNTSLTLSKEAINIAQDLGYSEGLAKAYFNAGISCRLSSTFETAIEYFRKALETYRSLKDFKGESRTLNALANVYYSLGNFKKAIEYYDECIFVLQSLGDLKFEAIVLTNRGLSLQQFGDLKASLNNYLECLSIYKSLDEPVHYALFNNLGLVYLDMGRYNEALKYFIEALKRTMKSNNVIDQGYTLANMGRAYIYMEEHSNAITYLSEAMIIMRKFGDRQAEIQVFSNLGKAYLNLRNYPMAIKYFNRALKYYREIADSSSVSHTLCELGEVYFELNDYISSRKYLTDGLELAVNIKDMVNEVRNTTGLAKLYVRFHDTETANMYLLRAEKIAKKRMSFKELSKIFKIYSDIHAATGNTKEAKLYISKHYECLKELVCMDQENKINAIMMGHIKSTDFPKDLFKKTHFDTNLKRASRTGTI